MLSNETTAESKAILGFTDGKDNQSTITSTELHNKLVDDVSKIKISSFMIGLEGKGPIETTVLKNLAVNGGVSQFPSNATPMLLQRILVKIIDLYNQHDQYCVRSTA